MTDEQEPHDDLSDGEPMESPKRLSEAWWAARPAHVQARRCRAKRSNRTRQCRRVAWAGCDVCGHHGAKAAQVKAKARRVLDEGQLKAADRLMHFVESDRVPAYVSLAATQDVLDRGGLAAPKQVELDVNAPWAEILGSITGIAHISQAESRARRGLDPLPHAALSSPGNIVDAEVVADPSPDSPADSPSGPDARRTGDDRADVPPAPGTGLQTMEQALEDLRWAQKRRPHY